MKKTVAILLTATMCATLSASLSSCINPLGGSDTTVTAEEWEQAFDFEVSALAFTTKAYVGMENETVVISNAINENSISFEAFGSKQYFEKVEDKYYFYDDIKKDGTIIYTREEITEEDFFGVKESVLTELRGSSVLEYDWFQYNKETKFYEAYDIMVQDVTMDCFISFQNDKVMKMILIDESESAVHYEFVYENIEITMPEDIVLTRTQWEQAFKFDLPAVNFVATQNVGTENEESHCWKFNEESLYVEDMGVPETYIVKVGDAYYGCGGQLENDEMIYNKYDSTEEEFLEARARVINVLESFFVGFEYDSFKYNTETKVYEAEGVMIAGMATDCSVIIQNNKVVKINFTFIQNEQEIKNCFEFSYDNVEITLPTIAE